MILAKRGYDTILTRYKLEGVDRYKGKFWGLELVDLAIC